MTKYSYETSIHLSVSANDTGIKSIISGVVLQVAPESIIQLDSCKLSANYLLGLSAFGRHRFHRRVYLLSLSLICTFVWNLIHFHIYVRTSYRFFRVTVKYLIWSVWFLKKCDELIFQSTSEVSTWFMTIMFSILIIRVPWIDGWFLIYFIVCLLLKEPFSSVWSSIFTAPWLSKLFSFCFSTELSKFNY